MYIMDSAGLTVFEKNDASMPNNNWPQLCGLENRDSRIFDLVPPLVLYAIGVYS